MIKETLDNWLANRITRPEESVQFGWFIFRIDNDGKTLLTLDFEKMASYTTDFSVVEKIHSDQMRVLEQVGVEICDCTLLQHAFVSKSYSPNEQRIFISREDPISDDDSGWYVGVREDPLDVNDPENIFRQSLYELSINDQRLLPYWLLPENYYVMFNGNNSKIITAEQNSNQQET